MSDHFAWPCTLDLALNNLQGLMFIKHSQIFSYLVPEEKLINYKHLVIQLKSIIIYLTTEDE